MSGANCSDYVRGLLPTAERLQHYDRSIFTRTQGVRGVHQI